MMNEPKKMNFLFIGVDQLRFDTLGVNGNDICKTPHLDKLAREGINYNRAYTTAPLCTPARASMFTGLYAFTHGMGTNCDMYHALSKELNNPEQLLHYKFLESGYKCGYVGKWHVGTDKGPCDFGFEGQNVPGYGNCRFEEEFKTYLIENDLEYSIESPIYHNPNEKTLTAGIWNGTEASTTDYYLASRTMDMMKAYTDSEEAFLLTCQFWGPHGPHFPPTSYQGITDRSKIEPWINFEDDLEGKPGFVKRHLRDFYRKPPKNWDEWKELIGLYYDYTTFIDAQIGRIIDYLDELGIRDNTTIIFTTDHGDMKGVHGGLIDKGFLYEEAMHIPFIVSHPEFKTGEVRDQFVSNMDILPTFMDIMGADISGLDGKSIMPTLKSETDKVRDVMYSEFHGIRFLYTQRMLVDDNNMKYIFTPGDEDELYDLDKDPGELTNLIHDSNYSKAKLLLQEKIKEQAVAANDPVMDYVYKIFGEWENPSGKIDITAQKK